MANKNEVQGLSDNTEDGFLIGAYITSPIFAVVVFGWQVFQWLQFGTWHPLPLSQAFIYFGADLSPIYSPQQWLGLAKIVQWFLDWPLSLGVPAICIATAHLWQTIADQK